MSSGRRPWSKAQRLRRAPEFVALSGPVADWRSARRFLALTVRWHLPEPESVTTTPAPAAGSVQLACAPRAPLRLGITASKRQARRAVARNMVKRVLREAARHAAPELGHAAGGRCVHVLFRLKTPLPSSSVCNWAELKKMLRDEADGLLGQLCAQLERQPGAAASTADGGAVVLAKSAAGAKPAAPGARGFEKGAR